MSRPRGLRRTAHVTQILLIGLGGVVILLLIFAITFSQRRRPGEPDPRE